MKRFRISDVLPPGESLDRGRTVSHVFGAILSGKKLYSGGVSFHAPGLVTHDAARPHTHTDHEMFCLLQGEGWIEINGHREAVAAGDVLLIEPGDEHHLISSRHNPLINLWLHANEEGHPFQLEPSDMKAQ